jgi:hypothetical protein
MNAATPAHCPHFPPHPHNHSAFQPTPLAPLNLWTLADQQLQRYLHQLLLLLACQSLLLLLLPGQLVCVLAAPAA